MFPTKELVTAVIVVVLLPLATNCLIDPLTVKLPLIAADPVKGKAGITFSANEAVVANDAVPVKLPVNTPVIPEFAVSGT